MSLLSSLVSALREREQASELTYAEMLARIINEESDLLPETVEQVLKAAGKTPEQLEKDVALAINRRELLEIAQGHDQAEADMLAVKRDIKTLTAEQEVVQRQFATRLQALRALEAAAADRITRAKQADRDLAQCADPELRGRQVELSERGMALSNCRSNLRQRLDQARSNLDLMEHKNVHGNYQEEVAAARRAKERIESEIATLAESEGELAAQSETLERELRLVV